MKSEWVTIFDVDGVFTPGNFFYTAEGKVMKEYGADDFDAVRILMKHSDVHIVSADTKGWPITWRRFHQEMGWKTDLVPSSYPQERWEWIKNKYPDKKIAYVGDGIFDWYCLRESDYGISPADSLDHVTRNANYVSNRTGGNRFVADACLHLLRLIADQWDLDMNYDR